MRSRQTLVPAFVLLLASPTQADQAPWFEMSAPAGVFAAAGLPESAEPAFSLLTLIRVLHGTAASDEAARVLPAVERAIAEAGGERLVLPLPLPPSTFLAVLPETTEATLFPALIRNRRAALFYYGVMAMDAETRHFLAAHPDLTRELARERAGAVAAFGRSVRVIGNRAAVPGGDGAAAAWEDLVGAPVTDAAAFIGRLFSTHDGRLAYLFDAIASLDGPRQQFALAGIRRLERAFTDIDREWSANVSPFARPMHDAALLLRLVPVDEAGVARAGMWRALWDAAFDGHDIPERPSRALSRVARGPLVDAGWLAESIALAAAPVRRHRYDQFAFGARRFSDVGPAAAPDAVVALRGFSRYPALMLSLERMGVTSPAVYAAAARGAHAVAGIGGQGRSVTALAQFQGTLAILDRAARSGGVQAAALDDLVLSLCALPIADNAYGGRVAAWIDEALLPAFGGDAATSAGSAETVVLRAMADRSPDADGRRFEWEGLAYVVDYGAGEVDRFEQVRAKQRANRLDAVLALAREVRALQVESRSLQQVRPQSATLESLTRELVPLRDWTDLPGSAPTLDEAALGDVVDHALAEVLLGLVYAPHQGEPAELFAASADLYHRHDFGAAPIAMTHAARARLPWARPRIQDAPGQRMRVTGSLLGLDLAMARYAVRRLTADRMPARPRLNQGDREVFMATAALVNPRGLTDAGMQGLAAALRQGRDRLAAATSDAATLDRMARDAGVSAVRRELLPWIAARRPAAVEGVFSLAELLRVGGGAGGSAWGVMNEPLTGCYCLAFPDDIPWEAFAGRPGNGHIAARVPDLVLRLVEILVEIGAPSAMFPGALSYATQDFVDEAPSMHTDDWRALVQQAHALDRLRVEDYLAAVAARGPLRPEGRP